MMDCVHVYQLAAVVIHRDVYKCTNKATGAVTSLQNLSGPLASHQHDRLTVCLGVDILILECILNL